MRRSNKLIEKRRQFIKEYYLRRKNEEENIQVKKIVYELSDRLFITTRTVISELSILGLTNTSGRENNN